MLFSKKITVPILAIFLAVVGYGAYLFSDKGPSKNDDNQTLCTQDALLCPDGAYVSRSGKNCTFAPCSGNTFTGILRQNPGGFFLILPSPNNESMEIEYAMPLEIKVSNVLGQIVGQKVKILGKFKEGANFSVDQLEELSGATGDASLGEVNVGESVFVNGVRITLNKISQDNRCPIDVQCIQAGWVTASVTLKSNTDQETIDIFTNKPPVSFDTFKISIENVKPLTIAGREIKQGDYQITFRVRRN